MKHPHTGLAALLLTSSLLFSPVCSSAAEPKPAPNATPQIHTILIKGLQFIPAELQVHVGDTVIWTNADIVPHTIRASKAFDSKNLSAGQSWQWVAQKTGHFNYACAYHPTMLGTLSVQ
jgi:plastocyanin